MDKHTPGPWHVVNPEFGRRGYVHGNTDTEHSYYVCELFTEDGYNAANARLIAAAPDLLAMLERVLSRCKNLDQSATHDGLENCQVIADARALIAKIKGK